MNAVVALLWCVLQVTVLASGAAIVYLTARRLHPRVGAAAVVGALTMVLLLTALAASPWPRWSFSVAEGRVARGATAEPVAAPANSFQRDGANGEEASGSMPLPQADLESPQLAFWTALVERLNNPRSASSAKPQAAWWLRAIGLLFILGALIAAVRLAWGVATVRRLARRANPLDDARLDRIVREMQTKLQLTGPIALRETNELATPATVGWRRPVVLLPPGWRSWTGEELRAALAHELAHIAGRDYAAWLVARLAVVAHFYHPLVRWLATRLQLEQELAADMIAASLVGDNRRYLHSLAALALATPPHRVAGPVRTLIPTRSLLARRVEMLRMSGMKRPRRPVIRNATIAVVALLGLAAAGLRGTGVESGSVARAQAPAAQSEVEAPVERLSLDLVPDRAVYAASFQIAQIVDDSRLHALVEIIKRDAGERRIFVEGITETLQIAYADTLQRGNQRIAVRFKSPKHLERTLKLVRAQGVSEVVVEGHKYEVLKHPDMILRQLDDRTVVLDVAPGAAVNGEWRSTLPPLKNPLPEWKETWDLSGRDAVVVAAFQPPPDLNRNYLAGGFPLQMIAPVIEQTDWAVSSVDLKDRLRLSVTLQCNSDESAENVSETLQAVTVLLKNMAQDQATVVRGSEMTWMAWVNKFSQEANKILEKPAFAVEGDRVRVALQSQLSTEELVTFAKSLLPTVEDARQAARQAQGLNNLKQLALAMHNYHDVNGSLPPAASYTYRKNGQTLKSEHPHSWRVELLPFLEFSAAEPLHEQYHFDESWDSESNRKVLAQMPDVFRSPHDDAGSTNTSYFVFIGPAALFGNEKGTHFKEVTDGLSKTMMIVEAKRPVPWTKPDDIPYAVDQPVPQLGGWVPGQFLAAIADGSVRPVSTDIDEAALRLRIEK